MSSLHDSPKPPAYEIIRELGRGTSGIIYLARCQQTNRLIALKVLLQSDSVRERQRFLREARAMAACRHDNIVAIYAVGEANGHLFCCREFIDGTTLEQHIAVPSSVREAARIVASLADALATVHRQGLTHRSLTPDNVLLSNQGVPKLIGFHRVRCLDDAGNGGQQDWGADIRALGLLLSQIVGRSGMTRGLDAIHAKCVAEPPRQYQTAQDLANDLRILTA
jgi:serine/threonine protein kinase